jgi:hypothetical protein
MSDIKLFHLQGDNVTELTGSAAKIEKSLQEQIEKNLDTYLGVRFLATEYSTGVNHGGRIDTLGIDENGSPVIIEQRYHTTSTMICSQIPVSGWHKLIGEGTIADAILDRIVYSSHRIELQGESMRKKQRLNQ